ncbi:NAD-dependent protein deacetylase sirtuin-7 [Orchesella cincta]|uniref:protein acetyllysine N-acetyltransferase n=1 Tax=Orchesella cincta TaxID=48709 RepID=A0A1D2MCV4_ORCCI|nr:NAD-dependent protein deacetylase sirtuin-7 [Orchesella cincta]
MDVNIPTERSAPAQPQYSTKSPSIGTSKLRKSRVATVKSSSSTSDISVRIKSENDGKPEDRENAEEDGIEVFRFDRNSLKLRCEKISPKQLNANTEARKNHLHLEQAKAKLKEGIKLEKHNDNSSSSLSTSSNFDSDSEESESSSSTSSSSSSSSSSSCSSSSCNSSSSSSDASSSSSSKISNNTVFNEESKKRTTANNKCITIPKKPDLAVTESIIANIVPCVNRIDPEPSGRGTISLGCDDADIEETINVEDLIQKRSKLRKNSRWADYVGGRKSSRLAPKTSFCNKKYEAQIKKRLMTLLKRSPTEWTDDERTTIQSFPQLVLEVSKLVEKRLHKKEIASERTKELEDAPEVLDMKCSQLASVISRARYLIIYTGAGISTSAKIPDYRGPNGIWTLLQKGEEVAQSLTDFSQTADPTFTHMAIKELWDKRVVKHIVSQNLDGLHLRSGIPKTALSEVHGNMYVEVCVKCGREFIRLFDVTENTRRHHHKTGRYCYHCGASLIDSVVLFGEKGALRWPLNWAGAEYHVDKADAILCLGSSLKVLRRYPWLWCMSKPAAKRPNLYIVNLQWTPKDQFAQIKINGRCDEVMKKVMGHLNIPIPVYERRMDTIFTIASMLHPLEKETTTSSELLYPHDLEYPEKNKDLRNYIRYEPVFKVPIPYENGHIRKPAQTEDNNDSDSNRSVKTVSVVKTKKRVLKGNNSSWLGNAVKSVNAKQKRKKIK